MAAIGAEAQRTFLGAERGVMDAPDRPAGDHYVTRPQATGTRPIAVVGDLALGQTAIGTRLRRHQYSVTRDAAALGNELGKETLGDDLIQHGTIALEPSGELGLPHDPSPMPASGHDPGPPSAEPASSLVTVGLDHDWQGGETNRTVEGSMPIAVTMERS
ncbi:MAG: hypothetical protein ACJ8DZ_13750 [Allosphingosinicella sp.]